MSNETRKWKVRATVDLLLAGDEEFDLDNSQDAIKSWTEGFLNRALQQETLMNPSPNVIPEFEIEVETPTRHFD